MQDILINQGQTNPIKVREVAGEIFIEQPKNFGFPAETVILNPKQARDLANAILAQATDILD